MFASLLHRPALRPRHRFNAFAAAEVLEPKVMLSATNDAPTAEAVAAAGVTTSTLVTIDDVSVTNLRLNRAGNLIATVRVRGEVLGEDFTRRINVRLNPDLTPPADPAECNVLNLALGPIELNVLGLTVSLDDCADGPVTVDITGDPEGGLLGELICGLTQGSNLDRILANAGEALDQLTGILDQVLGQLTSGPLGGTTTASTSASPETHEDGGTNLVFLEIPDPGISLNVLGLEVDTSAICLDISAERGPGNLLGNLLGNLARVLDGDVPAGSLLRVIDRIDRLADAFADQDLVDSVLDNTLRRRR